MGTSVYFNNAAASREALLLEDLIIESIKNHGIDVYYLPRESESELDRLFGDDPVKSFSTAYPIEMYLESTSDFEGQQEFFSKFGLEVDKQARVSVARRTFSKYVPSDTRLSPKEGDLIFIPLLQKLMEIKFVEQERNFFQLGKGAAHHSGAYSQFGKIVPYMYEVSLVAFKYNGERLTTGIYDIDNIADAHAYGIEFTMQAGGVESYQQHEIVYQGASLETATAKGYVTSWDVPSRKMIIRNIKGSFVANTVVKGVTSTAEWTLATGGNPQENAIDIFEDNVLIETEADGILDWTETNPFGTANETY